MYIRRKRAATSADEMVAALQGTPCAPSPYSKQRAQRSECPEPLPGAAPPCIRFPSFTSAFATSACRSGVCYRYSISCCTA